MLKGADEWLKSEDVQDTWVDLQHYHMCLGTAQVGANQVPSSLYYLSKYQVSFQEDITNNKNLYYIT